MPSKAEGVERIEATVEMKRELVDIGLQMPRADPVMRSRQPGLEIGEDEMADGQELRRFQGRRIQRWRDDRRRACAGLRSRSNRP